MVRSLATVKNDLKPVLTRLHDVIQSALKEFIESYRELRHKMSSRSAASVIHDLMRWHMEQEFPEGNAAGVRCVLKRSKLFVVMIADKYQIKLKKLDRNFRTFNVMTQQTFDFLNNAGQLTLDGFPDPTNLHLGYRQQKQAELLTSEIWLTCPNGESQPHWTMQIVPSGGAQVVPIPQDKQDKQNKDAQRRIKPRKQEVADDDRADGSNKKK
jgi:hypothetical protein